MCIRDRSLSETVLWVSVQDGFTPMAIAIQQRHDRVIAALQQAANSAALMTSSSLTSSLSAVTSRLPPLHAAAKRDDVELATTLLQRTPVCYLTIAANAGFVSPPARQLALLRYVDTASRKRSLIFGDIVDGAAV